MLPFLYTLAAGATMPTPFTHMEIACQLLGDPAIPADKRAFLQAHLPAYMLGSVIADARISSDTGREVTHFYRYDLPMSDHPWRIMLDHYPSLKSPTDADQRAFVAAYVAHLAVDEYWSLNMLKPHFANGSWGESIRWRFFVLHLLLIIMDERDEARLPETMPDTLRQSQPNGWLPFMPDAIICEWRDFIADQLQNTSETLSIFGSRIQVTPDELRTMLSDEADMQRMLWDHITPDLLHEIETGMVQFAREQMLCYLNEPD